MKKIFGVAAAVLLTLAAAGCSEETEYERVQDTISVGEFIQLGVYNNEPISWRCVAVDENGPLMLSDKILCVKAFDAAGENAEGSHGRGYHGGEQRRASGSNYWADSNIRTWLNSDAAAGQVEWICGNAPSEGAVTYNPYADEAGFLSGFTKSDLSYVKEVTQKAIIDGYEYSPDTRDESAYEYNSAIESIVSNYDTALAEETTDKIFLLDVKQLDKVYKNGNVLGNDYYIGVPTQAAIDNSGYNEEWFAEGSKWYYWIRTPNATDHGSAFANVISPDMQSMGSIEANDGRMGVRPAFYLNTDNLKFTSGLGTDIDPYKPQKILDE